MFKNLITQISLCAALLAAPATGWASSHSNSLENVAQVDVLPGWRTENGTHMAAIRIRLAKGWKTYWRSPGAAGIPPNFSWENSQNFGSVKLHWPTPTVFNQNGLNSIGYKNVVVIPIEVSPLADGEDITLIGDMELGVCEDICLPLRVSLRANLSVFGAEDPVIKASLLDRPMPAAQAGVGKVSCDVGEISDGLRVTARIGVDGMNPGNTAVIELADQSIWVSEAEITQTGGILSATVEMVPANAAPFPFAPADVRITLLGGDEAVDIRGCPAS